MNSTNPILRCFKTKKLNPERQKKTFDKNLELKEIRHKSIITAIDNMPYSNLSIIYEPNNKRSDIEQSQQQLVSCLLL